MTFSDKYMIWHKAIIVHTDPTMGGDIYCGELVPNIIWDFELSLTITWGLLSIAFILNHYIARKRVGIRF